MSRRALQIVTGLLGVIPLATGCIGLLGLRDPLYLRCGVPVGLDSNLRFYSGLWLGLGIAMYSILPSIERQTVLFRAFWGAIFLGGLGRLTSIVGLGRRRRRFPPSSGWYLSERLSSSFGSGRWRGRVQP